MCCDVQLAQVQCCRVMPVMRCFHKRVALNCGASSADIVLVLCLQQSVAQVGTILPPLSPTYQPMYVEGSMQLSQVRTIADTADTANLQYSMQTQHTPCGITNSRWSVRVALYHFVCMSS